MRNERALVAGGAFACSLAVALGAWAMHATLSARDHERLAIAAVFVFAHGLALAALAPQSVSRWRRGSLWILALGTILFSGSLTLAATVGWAPMLAPLGGGLLIAGWLLFALASFTE